MTAMDNDNDVDRVLRKGYDAPPPRPEFAAALRNRLRQELRATHAAAAPSAAPATATLAASAAVRPLPRAWPWLAAAAVLIVAVGLAAVVLRQADRRIAPPESTAGLAMPVPYGTPPDLARTPAGGAGMVALHAPLPIAKFIGTPKNIPPSAHLERYEPEKPQPVFMVPQGTTNVARGKPVKSSDSEPIVGELKYITDGDKEADDGCYVELGPNPQWVQIDLQGEFNLYAILVWHFHSEARVYHDVVVQVADDADFIENVRTVYNNDYDNSAGLGIGKDMEYIGDHRGRLIDAKGAKARYVRLYSKGNTSNDQNHYIEVEVHGKPAASKAAAMPTVHSTSLSLAADETVTMVPLSTPLPKPTFSCTPKNIRSTPYLEKYSDKPRPPFLVPLGTTNIAFGKPITSSDMEPIIGEMKYITDGDKEGWDGSYVEFGPDAQWVQIDLKGKFNVYAVLVWHFHVEARVYHDVVVQVADDPDFEENVRTLYNNDYDNSSGLGIGNDMEYIEDYRGRLIDARGIKARYVRLYSKGNTSNDQNHYTEVEVYGKSAAAPRVATTTPSVPLMLSLPREPMCGGFVVY